MTKRFLTLLFLTACAMQPGGAASWHGLPGERVNALRRAAGLMPVTESARAAEAASRHAADLARTGGTGHLGSDGSTHAQRLRAAGCRRGVENVAWQMETDDTVFAAWMSSPDHRGNILWPEARVYGLARAGDRWVLVLAEGCDGGLPQDRAAPPARPVQVSSSAP